MVGYAGRKDLGFVFQSPEGARVNYPVAIPLELISIGMGSLGIATPAPAFDRKPKMRERQSTGRHTIAERARPAPAPRRGLPPSARSASVPASCALRPDSF